VIGFVNPLARSARENPASSSPFTRILFCVVCTSVICTSVFSPPASFSLANDDIDDCDSLADVAADIAGDRVDADAASESPSCCCCGSIVIGVGAACASSPNPAAMRRPTPLNPSRRPAAPMTLAGRTATVFERACFESVRCEGVAAMCIAAVTEPPVRPLPVVGVTYPRLTIFSHLRFSSSSSAS
jgi:hypothetical protein